ATGRRQLGGPDLPLSARDRVCSGLLRHRHIAGGLTHALRRCGDLAGRLCLHSRSLSLRVSHSTGTVRDLLLCGGETLLSAT
ncbi:hypothetical protein KBZ21_41265, partial [Streptomyces sp. A73]|nr:hypothetical protein [Streptomyces sp. A73]